MPVFVDDLEGGYLVPFFSMKQRELWQRDIPANSGNVKVVSSPTYEGSTSLQATSYSTNITNLISNPSFETNTTGWSVAAQANVNALATSITRVTSDFYTGVASADVVFTSTIDSGARFAITGTFTSGVTYSFYIAIKSLTGATDFRLRLVSTGTPASLNVTKTFTATSQWQRIYMTATPTGTVSDVYLTVNRASAASATARIDSAMVYAGNSETPVHYDTTGSFFTPPVVRSDQPLDLDEWDGIGIALYSPSVAFMGPITLRFLTSFNQDANGDTDYTNLTGAAWYEYTIPGITGDSVATYGSGVYAVTRYAAAATGNVNWNLVIIPKAAFTNMGPGVRSWADIKRTEVAYSNLNGGATTLYIDAISGWDQLVGEENSANQTISQLPNIFWDTDPSRTFFQVVGWELDMLRGTLDRGLDQRFLELCDWGMRLHEADRGLFVDPPGGLERRRAAARATLAQIATNAEFDSYFTPLTDSGVTFVETFPDYRVDVVGVVASNTARQQLLLGINKTIPAHLQVSVGYTAFVTSSLTGTLETGTFTDSGSQP